MQGAVLIHELREHNDSVWCLGISGNSQRIASGSFDKTIKIWSMTTGNLISTLQDHEDSVLCVDFSQDAKMVASGGGVVFEEGARGNSTSDNVIRLWSLINEEAPSVWRRLQGHNGAVRVVKFSPNSNKLASASEDGRVIVWSMSTGKPLIVFKGHQGKVRCMAWSPDSKRIASGGDDMAVRVWDPVTGKQHMDSLKGAGGGINALVFAATNEFLLSASGDKTIIIWHLPKEGQGIFKHVITGHKYPVISIALCPNDMYVASTSEDMTVRIWDIATGQQIGELEGHLDLVNAVAWSPDGEFIVSASDDHSVCAWGIDMQVCINYL